jgi:hypothetical protein
MSNIERDAIPSIGPQFLEIDGETHFRFVIDPTNIIGPRKATKADKVEHEGAWLAYNEGRLTQLDHDKDGVPGGAAPRRGRPPKPKD